ncbi:MAG: tetratricopeptide repeat protein, partial [Candidatus Electrothrix sp. ATG2]|nr:tetratricopeptide repeat protein [Candidatus Electrothrix sp. ATG2]
VYSALDFNLHNGANGLYFAFFCALLVSAGNTRRYYQNSPTLLIPVRSSRRMSRATCIAALGSFCAILFLQGSIVLAEKYYQQARAVSSLADLKPAIKVERMVGLLEKAQNTDSLSGLYAYALANLRRWQQRRKEAVSLSAEAVLCQPMNFAYLQQLGQLLTSVDLHQARNLFESGYIRADQKILAFQTWAEFELSRPVGQRRLERLKKELEQNPGLLGPLYLLLSKYRLDQKEVAAILPEQTSAWIGFWDQLKKENRVEEYTFVPERALDFIKNESKMHPQYFTEVARYYRTNNNEEKAKDALRLGIRYLPAYAPFHILLGEIYLKEEDKGRAIKEYEQALLLDPENKGLLHSVRKLQ